MNQPDFAEDDTKSKDMQGKLGDMEFGWRPIFSAAAIVSSIGLVAFARRFAKRKGLFGFKKAKSAAANHKAAKNGALHGAMKSRSAGRHVRKSVANRA